jgi:hypothetical protein
MDWIDLAQDRDQWMALVNTVMNLRFHKMLGHFLVAARLAASQEGLSSMELLIELTLMPVECYRKRISDNTALKCTFIP